MSESQNLDNFMIDGWEDEEYQAFVDKFKAKKTTDDCYTPHNVYEAIANWVAGEYGLSKANFVRPFYPGGDYKRYAYSPECIVVDNPPFSIISKIVQFYVDQGIRFFLFAPALTLFNTAASGKCAVIPIGVTISYENGAKVATSFVTNLEPETIRVRTAPSLYQVVKAADDVNRAESVKSLPKYEYPDNIITAAMANRWCKYGVDYRLSKDDSRYIRALDAQKAKSLEIFGGGYLLSSNAAAERAAAERAAAKKWELSEEEKVMVSLIDKGIPRR